jgi:hypothetical protein
LCQAQHSAKKQWHLDKKKNKNGSSSCASQKPEVTIKPYDKVITKDAISDDGLFMVHKVDKKYYFEIKLLDKDMLLSRLSKLPLIWVVVMSMLVQKQMNN